jgi:hypothetical protein
LHLFSWPSNLWHLSWNLILLGKRRLLLLLLLLLATKR